MYGPTGYGNDTVENCDCDYCLGEYDDEDCWDDEECDCPLCTEDE